MPPFFFTVLGGELEVLSLLFNLLVYKCLLLFFTMLGGELEND